MYSQPQLSPFYWFKICIKIKLFYTWRRLSALSEIVGPKKLVNSSWEFKTNLLWHLSQKPNIKYWKYAEKRMFLENMFLSLLMWCQASDHIFHLYSIHITTSHTGSEVRTKMFVILVFLSSWSGQTYYLDKILFLKKEKGHFRLTAHFTLQLMPICFLCLTTLTTKATNRNFVQGH